MIQEFKTGTQLEGDQADTEFAAALDAGFHAGGWPEALRHAIAVRLVQQKNKTAYVSPFQVAQLYADAGDKDDAFDYLKRAYQEHDVYLYELPTDFQFDSLRSDPRYTELIHKIGFPQ